MSRAGGTAGKAVFGFTRRLLFPTVQKLCRGLFAQGEFGQISVPCVKG